MKLICSKYLSSSILCTFSICLHSSISFFILFVLSIAIVTEFCTMHHHTHQYPIPCLYCHPHSYIRMVHNLIERCLIFQMSQDQCIKALSEHAGIKPLVTLTVWRELEKENEEFFRAYLQQHIPPRPFMSSHFQRGEGLSRRKYWE